MLAGRLKYWTERELVLMVLSHAGNEVIEAANGSEALDQAIVPI
jgi:hypothetical protein